MSYVADPAGLVRGRPRVDVATKCEWLKRDTLFDTLARNNAQCSNQSCSVMCAVTHALSAKVPFKIEMFLSSWDNVLLLICPYFVQQPPLSIPS